MRRGIQELKKKVLSKLCLNYKEKNVTRTLGYFVTT
jgi:hypothetical protein